MLVIFLACLQKIETCKHNILSKISKIRVLIYSSDQWIVNPVLIKVQLEWHICTHENTWLCKVSWDLLQWTWCDPYASQGSKEICFFQFTTRLGSHIVAAQSALESVAAKVRHTYHVPRTIINNF